MKPARTVLVTLSIALLSAPVQVADAAEAPEFLLKTINPGRGIPPMVSLSMYIGEDALEHTKALVLYFMSFSDPGWQQDMDFLTYALGKLKKKGMRVVTILMDKGRTSKFRSTFRGLRFPVVHDSRKKVARRYGVDSAPGLFVVNDEGLITFGSVGFEEDLDEFLMAAVKKTLRGQPVTSALSSVGTAAPRVQAPPPPPPPPSYDDQGYSDLPAGDAEPPPPGEPSGRVVTPMPPPPSAPTKQRIVKTEPTPPPPPPPPPAPRETPEEKQLKLYLPLESGNRWEYYHRPKKPGDVYEKVTIEIVAGADRDFSVERTIAKYYTETSDKRVEKETWKLSPKGLRIVEKNNFIIKIPIRPGTEVGPRISGSGSLKVADVSRRITWSGRRLTRCVTIASGGRSDPKRDEYVFCPGVGLVQYREYDPNIKSARDFVLVAYKVAGKEFKAAMYREATDANIRSKVRNFKRAAELLAEGRKQFDSREYAKAFETFSAISEMFPEHGFMDSNYWLGISCLKVALKKNNKSLLRRAASALEAQLREDPGHNDALFQLGNVYLLLGRQRSAKATWRKVKGKLRKTALSFARNPRQAYDDLKPSALVEEAHENRKKGRLDDAIELYKAILKEYPNNEEAHLGLGLVYYSQNKLRASLREFQSVLKINDENRLALNYVRLVQAKLSR